MSTPRFCVLVRGERGRTWFRADSVSTADREWVQSQVETLGTEFPSLAFRVGEASDGHEIAPRRYRPWDRTPV